MNGAGSRAIHWGSSLLLALLLVAAFAPGLGLRDPVAQPDGLVLRNLPPLTRVDAIRTSQGISIFAHELRLLDDGAVDYRRGDTWKRLSAAELAGPHEADWHQRPRFWLGTDAFGRDLASRLVHGARVSLLIGLLGAAVAAGIGATLGVTAGLMGGRIDGLLMRGTDLVMAVPRLFLALLLVSLWGASLETTILVLGGTTWMAAARLVRGEVLSARERDYVIAARAAGAGRLRLAWSHLLPVARGPLVVETTFRVGDVILLESALSFLGLGVQPPAPSWGNMIAEGRYDLVGAWWVSTLPGMALALTVVSLCLLADGLGAPHRPRAATCPRRPEAPAPPAATSGTASGRRQEEEACVPA